MKIIKEIKQYLIEHNGTLYRVNKHGAVVHPRCKHYKGLKHYERVALEESFKEFINNGPLIL